MEAGRLSCCSSSPHHPLRPPFRGISRLGSRINTIALAFAVKSSCSAASSLSCDRPLAVSTQLSLLPVVAAFPNLAACLPVWAAEEALLSAEAASTQIPETVGAFSESAESAASQAVQSSAESIKDATESQVMQSSVESVRDAASQTVGAAVGDGNMVINLLGTAAFVALSVLSIAVVYLFITDFLAKRKSDEELKRLNEEEAAARRKKKGSLTPASKGGAKGFGRRQDDE